MNFVADELLTVAAGQTVAFTRATIDQDGGSRVIQAVVWSHDTGSNPQTVLMRYQQPPDESGLLFQPLAKRSQFVVDGYDNIRDLQFALATGSDTAKLFVQYFS